MKCIGCERVVQVNVEGVLPEGWQFTNRLQTERPMCGSCLLALEAFAESTVAEVFAPSRGLQAFHEVFEVRKMKP